MEPVAPRMETRLAILKLHTDDDRQSCRHRYREQAVDTVHQPAMTRQQTTRVLYACAALEPAFEQIPALRSEEQTSELQSLMRITYVVFCLKKKKNSNR